MPEDTGASERTPEPGAAQPGPATPGPSAREPEPPKEGGGPKVVSEETVDAVGDLVQMFVDYVRQQADDIVQTKVVGPLQTLGIAISTLSLAGCMLIFGLLWLSVGAFVALGMWLGWAIACVIVGGIYVLLALVFYVISRRNRQ